MPTGYTADVIDKDISFQQFALDCARNFGALVMMRDDDKNTEIPEVFEPSDYHLNAIEKARQDLGALSEQSSSRRKEHGEALKATRIEYLESCIAKAEKNAVKLLAMIAEVETWEPPTPDHVGMKKFMLEQLNITLKQDGAATWARCEIEPAREKNPMLYWLEEYKEARRSIEYHEAEHAKEVQRIDERTAWIKALRESLVPTTS